MAFHYDELRLQLYQVVISLLTLVGAAIEVFTSFATAFTAELDSLIARIEVARDFPNGIAPHGPSWEKSLDASLSYSNSQYLTYEQRTQLPKGREDGHSCLVITGENWAPSSYYCRKTKLTMQLVSNVDVDEFTSKNYYGEL